MCALCNPYQTITQGTLRHNTMVFSCEAFGEERAPGWDQCPVRGGQSSFSPSSRRGYSKKVTVCKQGVGTHWSPTPQEFLILNIIALTTEKYIYCLSHPNYNILLQNTYLKQHYSIKFLQMDIIQDSITSGEKRANILTN